MVTEACHATLCIALCLLFTVFTYFCGVLTVHYEQTLISIWDVCIHHRLLTARLGCWRSVLTGLIMFQGCQHHTRVRGFHRSGKRLRPTLLQVTSHVKLTSRDITGILFKAALNKTHSLALVTVYIYLSHRWWPKHVMRPCALPCVFSLQFSHIFVVS